MAMVLRRLAGASAGGAPSPAAAAAAAALLLRPALARPISTGFREERDTFGPIRVPNDKCVWFRFLSPPAWIARRCFDLFVTDAVVGFD